MGWLDRLKPDAAMVLRLAKHRLDRIAMTGDQRDALIAGLNGSSYWQIMALPEATIYRVIEVYAANRRAGLDHGRALVAVEMQRMGAGQANIDPDAPLSDYVRARVRREHPSVPGGDEEWFGAALETIANHFEVQLRPEAPRAAISRSPDLMIANLQRELDRLRPLEALVQGYLAGQVEDEEFVIRAAKIVGPPGR